jgi:glycosyltransferase involved in cell wall biosynthesis
LERSLSVLLPVRNVESSLEKRAVELLEVLPELTSLFEIIIVDDCSSDSTIEVADELMGRYPQVTAVRHSQSKGRIESLRTAFHQSRGDVIFLADENCNLSLDELAKMWQTLDHADVVFGHPAKQEDARRPVWKELTDALGGNYVMAFRHIVSDRLSLLADSNALRRQIASQDIRWHEIEMAPRAPQFASHHVAVRARRILSSKKAEPKGQRIDETATDSISSHPRQPNYLARLRELMFGE